MVNKKIIIYFQKHEVPITMDNVKLPFSKFFLMCFLTIFRVAIWFTLVCNSNWNEIQDIKQNQQSATLRSYVFVEWRNWRGLSRRGRDSRMKTCSDWWHGVHSAIWWSPLDHRQLLLQNPKNCKHVKPAHVWSISVIAAHMCLMSHPWLCIQIMD